MEKLEFGNLDHIEKAKDYQRQADVEDAKDRLSEALCEVAFISQHAPLIDALNGNEVLNAEVDDIVEDVNRLHDRITNLQTANT